MDQIDKGPAGEITYNGLQDFKNLLQTKISDFSKVGSNMPKEPLEDALRAVRTEMGSSVDKAVAGDPQLRKLLPEPYSFSDLLHQESRFYDIVDDHKEYCKSIGILLGHSVKETTMCYVFA